MVNDVRKEKCFNFHECPLVHLIPLFPLGTRSEKAQHPLDPAVLYLILST